MGTDHELVTATDDWSTFDTIGGYRPTRKQSDRLEFTPSVFLQRFLDRQVPEAKHEWLIVDELNRANIDKAFGSLFSALTGNTVTLPFETDVGPITLVGDPASNAPTPLTVRHYYISDSWRLIATMNTDDKASLYKMSYAFMRRFAFISVPVPDTDDISPALVGDYIDQWDVEFETDVRVDVAALWQAVQRHRPIGPALIKDVLAQLEQQAESDTPEYAYAMRMYVVPQLEGLPKRDIDSMPAEIDERIEEFDRSLTEQFIDDYLGITFDE